MGNKHIRVCHHTAKMAKSKSKASKSKGKSSSGSKGKSKSSAGSDDGKSMAYNYPVKGKNKKRVEKLDSKIDKLDRDFKKDERRTKKRLERDQRWDREVLRAKRITLTKVEDLDKGTVANTVQDIVADQKNPNKLTKKEINDHNAKYDERDHRYKRARRKAFTRVAKGNDRIKGRQLNRFIREYAKAVVDMDEASASNSYTSSSWSQTATPSGYDYSSYNYEESSFFPVYGSYGGGYGGYGGYGSFAGGYGSFY